MQEVLVTLLQSLFIKRRNALKILNGERAISQGFRGFITGILLPYVGNTRVEAWMFDTIRGSLAKWRAAV